MNKSIIVRLAFNIGCFSNYLFPKFVTIRISNLLHYIHSGRIYFQLAECKFPFLLKSPTYLMGGKYIKIGNNFHASYRFRMEAWDNYKNKKYNPSIIIGDNVSFSDNCHIGAINKIKIGNNVLIGSNVYITDHYHGSTRIADLEKHPLDRNLESKGSVIIDDDVWIGDGVSIMPNVTIGKSCIIGANSVVTKSFPEGSIIAGCPAKIIKS